MLEAFWSMGSHKKWLLRLTDLHQNITMNLLPMDRARLTVVAPLMTEGGTEAGPPIIWGPRPYRAARGTACWWWTGQGSPSHVCDMGGMEAAEAAAANMGTLWTDLMKKTKNISWKLGIRLFYFRENMRWAAHILTLGTLSPGQKCCLGSLFMK